MFMRSTFVFASIIVIGPGTVSFGLEPSGDVNTVRGYELIVSTPLITSDFTQDIFDQLWLSWPEPSHSKARNATIQERRRMAFRRYGLTTRPDDDSGKPLQFVVDTDGNWTMNCFACHGGSVFGTVTPGAPNNQIGLQTLAEEVRTTKFRLAQPLSKLDIGSLLVPLGSTHGTTNAVVFGLGLARFRDSQLNVTYPQSRELFTHHDMDAPPWWNFHKRPYLYIDGFAEKGHRGLMQFALIPENGPQFFHEHEDHFRDVFSYISSLRPPRYGGPLNRRLARHGGEVFREHCAECHGSYGAESHYPNRRIAIEDIGTDPVRLAALSVESRRGYAQSWFAKSRATGQEKTVVDPDGYVAPPLDGIWASPPYFHNGSVPTLWHVLNPEERPAVWRRASDSMDGEKVGFKIETMENVPPAEPDAAVRRSYFDTRRRGKSNGGHNYPSKLSESEKQAVLEYLKTL